MMENPLKDLYKGIAIGGEGFIEKIKEKIRSIGLSEKLLRLDLYF